MLTIFADDIARVAHLLILKAASDSKHKRVPTAREKHLREKVISQYFPEFKVIYNDNVYASEEDILMWIKEMSLPAFNYFVLPCLVELGVAGFHITAAVHTLLKKKKT